MRLELLAPARDGHIAQSAIRAGADAVYIAGPAFGARREAHNSIETLREICEYAHFFGAKVHLTLNTLLRDHELGEAQSLIGAAYEAGIDALIIQDPAVFSLDIPRSLPLHASTQCLINSVERLKFYASLGVRRVVLPRELTLKDIALFHRACPDIELEYFISGALCVCESGNCFLSEYLTGRSANRGCCAQPCRLPMVLERDGVVLEQGHLLNLKDNRAGAYLKELCAAGVTSFKIEGRLKDEAFVVNQTAFFRQRLDLLMAQSAEGYERASAGLCTHSFTPDLSRTFNRGFTAGLLEGRVEELAELSTPKFRGPQVARVRSRRGSPRQPLQALLKSGVTIHPGDGLCWHDGQGQLCGLKVNRLELRPEEDHGVPRPDGTKEQPREASLYPHCEIRLPEGAILYRNYDSAFDRELQDKHCCSRTLQVTLRLERRAAGVYITLEDELGRRGEAALALNPDPTAPYLPPARLLQVLGKCADERLEVSVQLDPRLEIRAGLGSINAARREAYAQLRQEQLKRRLPELPPVKEQAAPLPWPEAQVDPRVVLNQKAREFYLTHGALIGEEEKLRPLMTCAHCLIGRHCGGRPPGGKCEVKPGRYVLKISGHEFVLQPDCRHCRMLIKPGSGRRRAGH